MKISKFGKSRAFVFLAMAVALVFALHAPLYAASVPCYEVADNNEAKALVEVRWEDPSDGTYEYGDISVEITVHGSEEEGWTFDFESSAPVSRVVAKGGNAGACVYDYDPAVMSDTDLHAPMNPSQKYAGLSWIGFNFEEPEPPGDDDDDDDVPPPGDDDDDVLPPPGDDDDDVLPPPGDDDDDVLPYTEEEEEESLPFTGSELIVLFGAGLAATTGVTLRRLSR